MLNETFELRGTGCSTAEDSSSLPRHRWYVIKEGFSPAVFKAAAASVELLKEDTVLDPFCGSGTVPLSASLAGHTAYGIEVNPFLAFVSRTKLSRGSASVVRRHLPTVQSGIKGGAKSQLASFSTFSENKGSTKWLFNKPVLRSFEGGWTSAVECPQPARDLLLLALLGAAMDNCNATADGKCLRYRKDWKTVRFGRPSFEEAFEARVDRICTDLKLPDTPRVDSNIFGGDARKVMSSDGQRFKLCVTSPPYLNSFDYSDVYRPELFLGKFVESNAELAAIRKTTIRSHVQTNWEKPEGASFGQLFTNVMKDVNSRSEILWDRRIPLMIQAYFEDMERVLLRLRRLAEPGASVWIVVATSAYAGVEVPVDFIIAEIAERSGWFLSDVGVIRHLRSSGQHVNKLGEEVTRALHLRESVVILKTSKRA
jgi:DNA modification methylase